MPRSSCQPCCAPSELARNIDSYRQSVLLILCSLLEAQNLENLELLSVSLAPSSSGNNTVLAAQAGKRIRVYAYSLSTLSNTAVVAKFTDGAGGTQLRQQSLQAPASGSDDASEAVQPPAALFSTSENTALVMNLSAAQTVNVNVSYYLESV